MTTLRVSLPVYGSAVLVLALSCVVAVRISYDPANKLVSLLNQSLVLVAIGLTVLACLLLRRRTELWPRLVVAVTAVVLAGSVLITTSQSPIGLSGNDGDQSFRVAAMERFSLTPQLVDMGYKGLPATYPPLWFWVAGRVGAAIGVPGWEMMRWAQIWTVFLVPILGFYFWRRVAGPAAAAIVVVLTLLAVPSPIKVDEWLSLTVVVPWWLDAVANVRTPQARRVPTVVHGITAGLLVWLYTAYLLPVVVASVVRLVIAIRTRTWRLIGRWAVMVAIALAVWSPIWIPSARLYLAGRHYEALQFLWISDTRVVQPLVSPSAEGVLVVAGLCWLAWAAFGREHPLRRLARWHVVVCLSVVTTITLGLFVTALGHPILVQKLYWMMQVTLIAGAGLGGFAVIQHLREKYRHHAGSILAVATALLVAFVSTLGLAYVRTAVGATPLTLLAATQRPDGRSALGGPDDPSTASADEIAALILREVPAGRQAVLASDRYSLFTFYGFYAFNQRNAVYANPFGEYLERSAMLEQLAQTTDADQAADLVRHNAFEPIDALVLTRSGSKKLTYTYYDSSDFPNAFVQHEITFDRATFDSPQFRVFDLRDVAVVIPD